MRDPVRHRQAGNEFLLKDLELIPWGTSSQIRHAEDANGLFLEFEGPIKGPNYWLGVDVGAGRGLSNSVIHVLKEGTVERPDIQVGEWACNYVDSVQLVAIIDKIGHRYWNYANDLPAVACVENNNYGHLVLDRLSKDYNYPNIYVGTCWDHINNREMPQLGLNTNPRTRLDIVQLGEHRLKTRQWIINSPFFIEEMAEFELAKLKNVRALDQDLVAAAGRFEGRIHDDRLFAGFIGLYCLDNSRMDMSVERERVRQEKEQGIQKHGRIPDWRELPISYEEMMEEWDARMPF